MVENLTNKPLNIVKKAEQQQQLREYNNMKAAKVRRVLGEGATYNQSPPVLRKHAGWTLRFGGRLFSFSFFGRYCLGTIVLVLGQVLWARSEIWSTLERIQVKRSQGTAIL